MKQHYRQNDAGITNKKTTKKTKKDLAKFLEVRVRLKEKKKQLQMMKASLMDWLKIM